MYNQIVLGTFLRNEKEKMTLVTLDQMQETR